MDVNSVISQLIRNDVSFPALKLAWDCQVDLKDVGDLPKVTPSHYMNENQLTTDQRLALLCKQQRKIACWKPGVEVVVEPAIVVFQSYKHGDTLSVPINIRNTSKLSQKVAVLMEETSVFKFDENSQRIAKFPCGMFITATINFHPEDDRDYYHKIVITTNTTRFAIPIVCIGGRAILNAPDSIVFDKAPVKHFQSKAIPMCNTGTKDAHFTLSTTGPFCVKPEKGIVPSRESFSMEVSFYSEFLGHYDGYLLIKHENGEEIYIYLKADAVNLDIKLEPNESQSEDTYVGLKSQFLCSILNNSDVTVDFKWKNEATAAEPGINGTDIGDTTMDYQAGGDTLDRVLDLLEHCGDGNDCLGVAIGIEGQMIAHKGREQLFNHGTFLIEPLTGQVQPYSSMDIYIIFSPQEPILYSVTAYLDISGVEARIPLILNGKGLGPKFRFGFEVMDLGTIFLGGAHSYEIPILNVSEIPGRIEFDSIIEFESNPGSPLKVEPRRISLGPDEHGAFYVSFQCLGKPGDFQEELKFTVPNTKENVYVTIRGSVTFPRVKFIGNEAMVGYVSYGFPKTMEVSLANDSLNYVDICVNIDEDGKDPPIDHNVIISSFKIENFEFVKDPSEFSIEPSHFSLPPRGIQKIALTVCSNQVRAINKKLMCYIADKEGLPLEAVTSIPITGICIVPILQNECPEVILNECYMQFPYPAEFLVRNSTDLPACYCIVPQPSSKVKIQSDSLVGVAYPRQVTSIPVKVTCTTVGETTAYFDLYTVGKDEKVFTIALKIDCIPSKLEPTTKEVDFGNVKVLIPQFQTVEIVNSSPLTVPYIASINDCGANGDKWELSPEYDLILPYSTTLIGVTVTLQEAGIHKAYLHIQMTEALAYLDIKMKATGIGSSIKFSPHLERIDEIDFGAMFTKVEKSFQYEVTNVGHLPKILDWRHVKDPEPEIATKEPNFFKPLNNNKEPPLVIAEPKRKVKPEDFYMKKTPFTITPLKRVLPAKSSMIITFTANSQTAIFSEEDVILWTYAPMRNSEGDSTKHINQMSRRSLELDELRRYHDSLKPVICREIKLKALYEAPSIGFSKRSILFRIDATPTEETYEQRDTIKLENLGMLPVKVDFKVSFPFSIILDHQRKKVEDWSYHFKSQETIKLTINFDSRHLRKEKGAGYFDSTLVAKYVDFPGSDIVALRGEIYFPTLQMEKNKIDFGTIVNGTEAVEEFTVSNTGTFCLTFKWYIKANSTSIKSANGEDLHPHGETKPLDLQQSVTKELTGINEDFALLTSEYNFFKDKSNPSFTKCQPFQDNELVDFIPNPEEKPSLNEYYDKSNSEASLDGYGEPVPFLRANMHRIRVLEMVGLQDPDEEIEDETNYLSHNRDVNKSMGGVSINEIIDIIPLAGIIPSGQTQTFTVVFYGHPDITFKTTAYCSIEGGTARSLDIQGGSTHISVAVIPRSLSLGTMRFNDVVTRNLTVKNICKVPMDVRVSRSRGRQSEDKNHVGCLEIVPMNASIPAGGSEVFQISYIPGTIGKFDTGFWVKARYCYAIKISIEGEALYPMLSVLLPRNLNCLPLIFVYHVIAKLVQRFHNIEKEAEANIVPEIDYPINESDTIEEDNISDEFIKAESASFHELFSSKDRSHATEGLMHSVPDPNEGEIQMTDEFNEEIDAEELGWEIIEMDQAPSFYIISDAIERELVTNYVNKLYSNESRSLTTIQRNEQNQVVHKFRNLKLDLPEYVMDLGEFIAGQEITYPLEVGNPGPISTNVHIAEGNLHKLKSCGIIIRPEEIRHISKGGVAIFELKILLPLPKEMNSNRTIETVDERIYLQIKGGPRIPVTVKGRVYFPVLTVSSDNLDFGTLRLNMFKTMTFEICNVSLIPIEWSTTIDELQKFASNKEKRPSVRQPFKLITFDEAPFQIWPTKGIIFPGHKETLQISFTPAEIGKYLQTMRIRIGDVPFVTVKLKGSLEDIHFKLSSEHANFGNILPYNIASSQEIHLFNPNDFAVEVYLVQNDRKYLQEERIKRFLLRYYGSAKLSLPYQQSGKRFPKVFKKFFKKLIELFKRYLNMKSEKRQIRKLEKAKLKVEKIAEEKRKVTEKKKEKKLKRQNTKQEEKPEGEAVRHSIRTDHIVKNDEIQEPSKKSVIIRKKEELMKSKSKAAKSIGKQEFEKKIEIPDPPFHALEEQAEDQKNILKIKKKHGLRNLPKGYLMKEKVLLDFLKKLKMKNTQSEDFNIFELLGNPIEKMYASKTNELKHKTTKHRVKTLLLQTHTYLLAKKRPHKITHDLKNFNIEVTNRLVLYKEDKPNSIASTQNSKQNSPTDKIQNNTIISQESSDKKNKTKTNPATKVENMKLRKSNAKGKQSDAKSVNENMKNNKSGKSGTGLNKNELKTIIPLALKEDNLESEDKINKMNKKSRKYKERPSIRDGELLIPKTANSSKLTRELTSRQKSKLKLKNASGQTRWIMRPKEKFTIKIEFKPRDLGEYHENVTFEIGRTHQVPALVSSINSQPLGLNAVPMSYNILLKGTCTLPSISNSPEIIFPKIIESVGDNETINRVYIRDEDCFDFGPTLVPMRKSTKSIVPTDGGVTPEVLTHKVKHRDNVSKFLVKNISGLPAICTLSLVHERRKYFEFQPSQFTVKPGEEQRITLWAYPRVPDVVVEDHLVFCIKDNPDPIFFRIRVMGTIPQISMETDMLDFGRCLLNSRSVAQVTVKNTGLVPVVWQISKDTPLPEQVYAEKTHGILKPKDSTDIRFLFKAGRPIVINEHTINIEFRDTIGLLGIIDVFKVAMYGEAYDVLVDIASEKADFTLINLGVLPVGYPVIENLIVTNRGNYEIYFKFTIEAENLSSKQRHMTKFLKDYMIVHPMEDTLGSNEGCIVQIVFEPPRELDFINEPILKCQLVDLNMNVLVAELIIPVTVKGERNGIPVAGAEHFD